MSPVSRVIDGFRVRWKEWNGLSWARFSDTFYRNDKQLSMSDGAFRLYVCAVCYAMHEPRPTGFLSDAQVAALSRFLQRRSQLRDELVALKAWEEVGEGILIHDFEEYVEKTSRQRTKAWRDRKRAEGDVTTPSQKPKAGDVTVTPRAHAHDGLPVPVPVPVYVKGSPIVPLSEDWAQICQAWETLAGHSLSAKEREEVHKSLAENHRLPTQEIIGHLGDFVEWWDGQHIERRPTFNNAASWLKDKNNKAADEGRRPVERLA